MAREMAHYADKLGISSQINMLNGKKLKLYI